MGEESVEELKLNGKMFKVLASDIRREIIKKLANRQMTVSELSRSLNISKSTVFTNLDVLVEAGLLNKKDTNNEWVYYMLTEKGRALININKKIVILLGSSALSLAGGFTELYKYLIKKPIPPIQPSELPLPYEIPSPLPPGRPPLVEPLPEALQRAVLYHELIIGVLLIMLSMVLFYHIIILRRKYTTSIQIFL